MAAVASGEGAQAPPPRAEEPASASERYLAALWSEIVGLEQVSRPDRFLDVGGNSLTLNIILNRIETEQGVSFEAESFFDPGRSSLAALAEELDALLAARVGANVVDDGSDPKKRSVQGCRLQSR